MKKLTEHQKIEDTPEAWEEGLLGMDDEYVGVWAPDDDEAILNSLGLESVALTLPRDIVDSIRNIAAEKDITAKMLMQQVLVHFVESGFAEKPEAELTLAIEKEETADSIMKWVRGMYVANTQRQEFPKNQLLEEFRIHSNVRFFSYVSDISAEVNSRAREKAGFVDAGRRRDVMKQYSLAKLAYRVSNQ